MRAGRSIDTNPVIFYNFATGTYSDFIVGGQDGVGHLIGLASTSDSLFLADLSSADGWTPGSGVIYEISAAAPVPEPSCLTLAAMGLALLAAMIPIRRSFRGLG